MKKLLLVTAVGFALMAASTAQAAYGIIPIKVECWSTANCDNLTLQTICETQSTGTPVSVAAIDCSQTSTNHGYPEQVTNNPAACGSATCEVMNQVSIYDRLGKYCQDTGSYDAIVYCQVQ